MSKTYTDYKDSKIEWVGIVPDNWKLTSVGKAYEIVLGKMLQTTQLTPKNELVSYLKAKNVQDGYLKTEKVDKMYASPREIRNLRILPGDLLVCEGGEVARSVVIKNDLGKIIFQNSLHRVRSYQKNDITFLHYYLISLRKSGFVDILVNKATIAHFTKDKFKALKIILPSFTEQKAIVKFLNKRTREIEDLIADKETLITLLQEKRQSIITEAVTKGLNSNVKMKDSGSEWLGQVPEHWIITSLKNFWSVIDCKHVTAEFVDEGIPVASIREVQGRFVDLNNAKKTTKFYYDQLIEGGRKPIAGDLIFSRNATVGEVAQVAPWHPAFAIGQDVCVIRKNKGDLSSEFLQYIIRSKVVIEQLENLMVGATFKRVNVEDIRNLVIPMPPSQEQALISSFLENKIGKINALINEVYNTINLLKEYRQSLIYEAVTGKIDVRNFEVVS